LELIKDGSIMYTRKLQATEATTFDYTAPATGEYTWRMRSSSIGTTTTQPLTYSLDNLSIFYTYPYTIENCDNLADGYRFGFNGKEDDREVEGQQDYGLRTYDVRIARFKSIDPLTQKFPWYTPYQFAGNSPIRNTDLDGAEPLDFMETWNKSNSGSLNSNTEAFTFKDVSTNQNYSVKVVHNQEGGDKYYWAAKMGADGKGVAGSSHPIGTEHFNAKETVWQRFEPNSSVKANQEMMYNFADKFPVAMAAVGASIVSAPFLAATGLFGVSTELWGLKAGLSIGLQQGIRGSVDMPDVFGDAVLAPGSSALLGATMDFSFKGGEVEMGVTGLNKGLGQSAQEFSNSMFWGGAFGAAGNAIGETGSKAADVMIENTFSTISVTGEQCVEKNLISPDGE
jgi:RHS repeat-associated protein